MYVKCLAHNKLSKNGANVIFQFQMGVDMGVVVFFALSHPFFQLK